MRHIDEQVLGEEEFDEVTAEFTDEQWDAFCARAEEPKILDSVQMLRES